MSLSLTIQAHFWVDGYREKNNATALPFGTYAQLCLKFSKFLLNFKISSIGNMTQTAGWSLTCQWKKNSNPLQLAHTEKL